MEKNCNVGNKFDIFMSLHVTEVTVDRETNWSLFCFCVYVLFTLTSLAFATEQARATDSKLSFCCLFICLLVCLFVLGKGKIVLIAR